MNMFCMVQDGNVFLACKIRYGQIKLTKVSATIHTCITSVLYNPVYNRYEITNNI